MGLTKHQVLLMVGMLITGTINTLVKSIQLRCIADGYPDSTKNGTITPHKFSKPWFQTLLMFLGEALCLLGVLAVSINEKLKKRKYSRLFPEDIPAVDSAEGVHHKWHEYFIFLLPTACDLMGTSLAGIGLLFISASIWQMMRGCLIVFTGLLSMIFLKRKLYCYNWTGMSFTVIGLALVGTASVFTGGSDSAQDPAKAILGIGLVLAGCLCTAAQMIVEERFLKHRGFIPLQVVGLEGTFGTILMSFVALPIMQSIHGEDVGGIYENTIDTLYMMTQSTPILLTSFFYMISIAFYNYFGLSVVKTLTSVHRTLIDAMRTLLVWIVGLIIYYLINKEYGEEFNTTFGILQLDGFACLIIGTAIYNRVMVLDFIPFCRLPIERTTISINAEDSQRSLRTVAAENSFTSVSPINQTRPVSVSVGDTGISDEDDVEIPSISGRRSDIGIVPSPK